MPTIVCIIVKTNHITIFIIFTKTNIECLCWPTCVFHVTRSVVFYRRGVRCIKNLNCNITSRHFCSSLIFNKIPIRVQTFVTLLKRYVMTIKIHIRSATVRANIMQHNIVFSRQLNSRHCAFMLFKHPNRTSIITAIPIKRSMLILEVVPSFRTSVRQIALL